MKGAVYSSSSLFSRQQQWVLQTRQLPMKLVVEAERQRKKNRLAAPQQTHLGVETRWPGHFNLVLFVIHLLVPTFAKRASREQLRV